MSAAYIYRSVCLSVCLCEVFIRSAVCNDRVGVELQVELDVSKNKGVLVDYLYTVLCHFSLVSQFTYVCLYALQSEDR